GGIVAVSDLITFDTQGNVFGGWRTADAGADAGNLAARVAEMAICMKQ
ncbi:TPA: hypothetical protein OUA92_004328, partial [Enterobacter hormaechei]|nr:hypothetical protein [Enterobacter hormaechei]